MVDKKGPVVVDGGAAFPTLDESGGVLQLRECGMSLRDYFAAQVVAGWNESYHGMAFVFHSSAPEPSEVARLAYEIADQMLEARK